MGKVVGVNERLDFQSDPLKSNMGYEDISVVDLGD